MGKYKRCIDEGKGWIIEDIVEDLKKLYRESGDSIKFGDLSDLIGKWEKKLEKITKVEGED